MSAPQRRQAALRHQSQASDDNTGDLAATSHPGVGDEFYPLAAISDVEALAPGLGMLVVKRGPNAGSRFRLDQPVMTVGRHPASDIYLDDITVSRRHAEFRKENGEFHVVDLGSLNNTYLNREAVDSAVLANGDEIQIGNFRLVFIVGPGLG